MTSVIFTFFPIPCMFSLRVTRRANLHSLAPVAPATAFTVNLASWGVPALAGRSKAYVGGGGGAFVRVSLFFVSSSSECKRKCIASAYACRIFILSKMVFCKF
jgi:hypothetical protein